MQLTAETPITIQYPDEDREDVTTWGRFAGANDPDIVDEVREQIEANFYAEIGGGAAPVVWVFA